MPRVSAIQSIRERRRSASCCTGDIWAEQAQMEKGSSPAGARRSSLTVHQSTVSKEARDRIAARREAAIRTHLQRAAAGRTAPGTPARPVLESPGAPKPIRATDVACFVVRPLVLTAKSTTTVAPKPARVEATHSRIPLPVPATANAPTPSAPRAERVKRMAGLPGRRLFGPADLPSPPASPVSSGWSSPLVPYPEEDAVVPVRWPVSGSGSGGLPPRSALAKPGSRRPHGKVSFDAMPRIRIFYIEEGNRLTPLDAPASVGPRPILVRPGAAKRPFRVQKVRFLEVPEVREYWIAPGNSLKVKAPFP